ncbi:hypothetical protein DB347_13825 [Opitutaceae bacterium EW11]|nr:hypothetical protein DB347_13825 [Opitutaceae bacterium EW11]
MSLHLVAGLWILALLTERRRPDVPRLLLVSAAAFVVYVWARLMLGSTEPLSLFTQQHFGRIAARWPESVILRTPRAIALLWSGLTLGLVVASDLMRRSFWRRAIPITMVTCGAVVVFIGLLQNATRARGIYWQEPLNNMPSRFFGPFYHFTSAGAFINLTWPLAASLALYSFRRFAVDGQPPARAVAWALVSLTILLGHAGHVSRFPPVIAGVVLIVLFAVYHPWTSIRWSGRMAAGLAAASLLAVAGAFWTINKSGRLGEMGSRWRMLHVGSTGRPAPTPPPRTAWPDLVRDDLAIPWDQSHYFLGDRGAAYVFACNVVLNRPLFGYGPGGWIAAVSQSAENPAVGTFYLYLQFTHEDFLQTLVEWGILGATLTGVLLGGGLWTGVRRLRRDAKRPTGRPDTPALVLGALGGLVAVLVQSLIDFPLQIPANALYASMLLALCWSSTPRRAIRESRPTTSS